MLIMLRSALDDTAKEFTDNERPVIIDELERLVRKYKLDNPKLSSSLDAHASIIIDCSGNGDEDMFLSNLYDVYGNTVTTLENMKCVYVTSGDIAFLRQGIRFDNWSSDDLDEYDRLVKKLAAELRKKGKSKRARG